MKSNISKNAIWNIIGITANSFISLFLLIIVTRINGVDTAGIYSFAFSVSLIFNMIGVYYGRVYQASDKSKISDYDFLVSKTITCLIMMIVTLAFILINRYDFNKSLIIFLLCVFKCVEAFIESIYAIIQKNDELYKVGISFTVKALISTIAFLVVDLITKDIALSSLSIIGVHTLTILLYDLPNLKKIKMTKKITKDNVVFLLKDGFYPFVISFLSLYIVNASKYAIDLNMDNSSQTIFGIIVMPATVISMFVQYILHPYILLISDYYHDKKKKELNKLINKFYLGIGAIGLLGVLVAATFGIPVLGLIYGVDLSAYKIQLVIIMTGAILYGIVNILSNILIIMRNNKLQSLVLFIMSIVTFVVSYYLTKMYGLIGASISYSIIMLVLFVIYRIIISLEMKKGD